MNQKLKLKIGEFSRLSQVTVKTLRLYEEIGLLMPIEIDDYTGYRYYDVSQMQMMNNIIYLKNLGFNLEEIRTLFEDHRYLPSSEMIAEKLNSCHTEMKLLKDREIQLKILQEKIIMKEKMKDFEIRSLPAVIVASFRKTIHSYGELFDLCPNVVGPEMDHLGCKCPEPGYCYTIDHNKEYCNNNIDIEYCEAVSEKKQDSELIQFKDIPAVEQETFRLL